MKSDEFLKAALLYAGMGWRIFPVYGIEDGHCACKYGLDCKHPGKHPMTAHGFKDGTTDSIQLVRWWNEWPEANIGLATGPQLYVIDVDPRNGGAESLKAYCRQFGELPKTLEAMTGGGGRHIYLHRADGAQKSLAGNLGRGIDIKGQGGYVILPPSRHISGQSYLWASPPDSTPIAEYEVSVEEKTFKVDLDIHEGARNTRLTSEAGRLRVLGLNEDAILRQLLEFNQENCAPPLEYQEVRNIAHSIGTRYPPGDKEETPRIEFEKEKTEEQGFKALSLAQLMALDLPPLNWLAEGLIPDEGAAILGGYANVGKTWMLMDFALEFARGGKWLEHFETKQGSVLYIDEENGLRRMKEKLQKLLNYKSLPAKDLPIHVLSSEGIHLGRGSIEKLVKLMEELKPKVVIIDSLIRVHGGDENSSRDMAKVFGLVKQLINHFGCLFFFADHHRKPGPFQSAGDIMLRGSSEKSAFVDILISLQVKQNKLVVENPKNRDAERRHPFCIEIIEPDPGAVGVKYIGEAEEIEEEVKADRVSGFIARFLADGEWHSKPELIQQSQKEEIASERTVYYCLKSYLREHDEIESLEEPTGKGGPPLLFYRLRPPQN